MRLKIEKDVPVKETYTYLAHFPRFSLIEKIPPKFYLTSTEASVSVANVIKNEIQRKNQLGLPCVLGLATGSTPLGVYKELIRMYEAGELSFKNVITFNLDEYYPISKSNQQSYNYYMRTTLFNKIDILPENINIPDGEIERNDVAKYCEQYEKKIKDVGGIDLQILGIGRTGHIGFNEPPAPSNSTTRLVYLHRITRKDAATSFGGIDKVPKCAISMGIASIRMSKKIVIMAWSESKAPIVKRCIEGEISTEIPATFLHLHEDATFYLDKAAGEQLSRFNIPWTIKGDQEDPIVPKCTYWIIKCVVWLSERVNKPILRLVYEDYENNSLSELVIECAGGSTQDLNEFVHKRILSKITEWPLGESICEPSSDCTLLPKRAAKIEKVLIFSPHPDDDVISMGGTIKKLQEQGHEIYVAYMTSGTNAVFNHDASKYLHFLKDFSIQYFWKGWKERVSNEFIKEYDDCLDDAIKKLEKEDVEIIDSEFVRQIKQFIRSSEAKIAIDNLGVHSSHALCLNLPFYGLHLKKKSFSEEDFNIVKSALRLVEPTVIFAAGDLTDPHGTHRKCLELLLQLHAEDNMVEHIGKKLFPPAEKFFLYRGAWEEWSIPMARIINPLSPAEMDIKLSAILKHQSQKDTPMFPGDDKREFWLRVKERNRNTAEQLHKIGFTDYEAAECFVNLKDFLSYVDI